MVTIISTGDRESDLFHWAGILQKNPALQDIPSIDCSTDQGLQKLQQKVETVSLFTNDSPVIATSPTLTEELLSLLLDYTQDVYIISPAGKVPKNTKVKTISEKISDTQLKNLIADTLRSVNVTPNRDELARLYIPLTIEDFMGKEKLSPLRCMTFVRQLRTIEGANPEEAQKLFTSLVGLSEGKASQWEVLANLFSTQKRKQKEYFQTLTEHMSPYEIMALAKSTLLLVMIILAGQHDHLDSASIAGKIGKHPFYVSSLLRTVQDKGITYDKAQKMLTRLFNLETALKSGKFDDEQFGFEVLLATL